MKNHFAIVCRSVIKRKIRLLTVCCIFVCFLCACGQSGSGGSGLPEDGAWSRGRYLQSNNSHLIIFEVSSSPCVMSAADETVLFEGLTDGDMIRVYVCNVLESWPEQAAVYAVEKLEDGAVEDIDSGVLEMLREYGWVD